MNKKVLISCLIFFLLFWGCSEKSISEKQKAINAYKEKQSKLPIANSQPEETRDINEDKLYLSLTEEEIPLTFYKKGIEYASQGKFEEAKKEFNKALEIYKFDEASNKILTMLRDMGKGIVGKEYIICFFKGENYNLNGNAQQAITEFQKAIQINSNLSYAYEGLGVMYFSLGKYQQAITEFQKSIQTDHNSISCRGTLGLIYNVLGQFQKARTELEKSIEMNPNYARTYAGFGTVYLSMGQTEQAITEFQKAIQVNPDVAEAYGGLGAVYQFLGQYQKAANYNQKAIEVNPGDWSAYFGLGVNHLYLDKFREAIPYFQKSIQIIPKLAQAHRGIGFANFSLGRYEEAREAFQKAKELFQSEDNYEKTERMQEYLDKIKELVED